MMCPECPFGRLQETTMPYLCEYGGYVFIAQSVPSLVCDVCGRSDYDPVYIRHLSRLMDEQSNDGPGSGQPGHPLRTPFGTDSLPVKRSV